MWIDPWTELELDEETADRSSVKEAYARKLKSINIEEDRDAFLRLRLAYEEAMSYLLEEDDVTHRPSFREIGQYDADLKPTTAQDARDAIATTEEDAREAPSGSQSRPMTDVDAPKNDEGGGVLGIDEFLQKPRAPMDSVEEADAPSIDVSAGEEALAEMGETQRCVTEVIAEAEAYLQQPKKMFDLSTWRKVFWAPELEPLEAARDFEARFLQRILEITGWGERKHPRWPRGASREFATLIDERFGWLSDGIAFQRRFGAQADWAQHALMDIGARTARRAREGAGFRYRDGRVKRLPVLLRWGTIIIIYFLARGFGLPPLF